MPAPAPEFLDQNHGDFILGQPAANLEESIVLPSSDNDDFGESQRRRTRLEIQAFSNGEARLSKYEQFHISLCTLIIALVLSIVTLMIAAGSVGIPSFLYLQEHKQLIDDWTTQPYVDIVVRLESEGCPEDYEALIFRPWNGTHELCVES